MSSEKKYWNREISQLVKELRQEWDLSLSELANNFSVAKNTIHRYEAERAKPEPQLVVLLGKKAMSDPRTQQYVVPIAEYLAEVLGTSTQAALTLLFVETHGALPTAAQLRRLFARAEELLK